MARLSGPFIPATDGTSEARRLRLVGAPGVDGSPRAITVLHVGDTPDDTFLIGQLVRLLPSFTTTFVAAGTREAALSALRRHPCDIVLCDLLMGGRTTVPLIDEIKTLTGLPVVLTSPLDGDDVELIGRRAGADGLLAKADLAVPTLDRVFRTVLPPASAAKSVAATLKALIADLYAVGLTLRPERPRDDADDLAARRRIERDLYDLDQASRDGAGVERFDAVPSFADAARRLRQRAANGGRLDFVEPRLPILIETAPTLLSDLVDGFLAEAGETLSSGGHVTLSLSVERGRLTARLLSSRRAAARADAAQRAVTAERRHLVERLALAASGAVGFGSREHRLMVPLRLRAD